MNEYLDFLLEYIKANGNTGIAKIQNASAENGYTFDVYKAINYLRVNEYIWQAGTNYTIMTKGDLILHKGGFSGVHKDEQEMFRYTQSAAKYAKWSFYATLVIIAMTIIFEIMHSLNSGSNGLNSSQPAQQPEQRFVPKQ